MRIAHHKHRRILVERIVHEYVGNRVRIIVGGIGCKGSISQHNAIAIRDGTHGKVDTAALEDIRIGYPRTSIHRLDRRGRELFSPQHERVATVNVIVGDHAAVGIHDQ